MHRVKFWLASKNQVNDLTCLNFPNNQQRSLPNHIYVSSPSSSCDESDLYNDGKPKKFVIYGHVTNGDNRNQLTSDTPWCEPPNSALRVFPIVGVFTVQCDSFSKWRLIPTKKKYE